MTRRNPKLSPKERLASQIEPMAITPKPRAIALGDKITQNGIDYIIHDADDTGVILRTVQKFATVTGKGIAACSDYIHVPYSQLHN